MAGVRRRNAKMRVRDIKNSVTLGLPPRELKPPWIQKSVHRFIHTKTVTLTTSGQLIKLSLCSNNSLGFVHTNIS